MKDGVLEFKDDFNRIIDETSRANVTAAEENGRVEDLSRTLIGTGTSQPWSIVSVERAVVVGNALGGDSK